MVIKRSKEKINIWFYVLSMLVLCFLLLDLHPKQLREEVFLSFNCKFQHILETGGFGLQSWEIKMG